MVSGSERMPLLASSKNSLEMSDRVWLDTS